MSFNVQTWKAQINGRAPGWRQRFAAASVPSVYASLGAAALWPVVAATTAGDWGAMAALGGVVGGGHQVAALVQTWQDEADGARQLASRVQEPALQKELDAILAKLGVVTAVHDALPAADRAWFVATLRQELAQLGNASRYTAVLKGSGALAQGDNAVAVGERGVHVGGSVQGSIITGDGNTIMTGGAGPVAALPPALAPLRHNLSRYFDISELSGLCFDMGIPFDDLPGQTRTEKAQALVALCYRDDRLPELLALCRQYRPHGDWTYPDR